MVTLSIYRAVGYICMVPKSLCTSENLANKVQAYHNMYGHGHDPRAIT